MPVPVIPVLEIQRQEDHEYEASLGCMVRAISSQNKNKTKQRKKEGKEGRGGSNKSRRTTGWVLDKMLPVLC